MPQCLNILNEINGMNSSFIFPRNESKIILDISKDPNYRSLKNVEIEFDDSNLYNKILIVSVVKNGERNKNVEGKIKYSNIERIEFSKTFNFANNKIYQIPYRIIETKSTEESTECHLSSDSTTSLFSYLLSRIIMDTGCILYVCFSPFFTSKV